MDSLSHVGESSVKHLWLRRGRYFAAYDGAWMHPVRPTIKSSLVGEHGA